MNDQQLVLISTKELNKLMKRLKLSKERRTEIKAERRTLKNRGYAANSRVKKENEEKTLEDRSNKLRKVIENDRFVIQNATREMEAAIAKCREKELEFKQLREEFYLRCKENEGYTSNLLANRSEIKWEKVKEEPPYLEKIN